MDRRPLPVLYSSDVRQFLKALFSIRPNVLCQSCSQSDTLTFLFDISATSQWKLPHEWIDISHLSAPLALNEQQRFIYGRGYLVDGHPFKIRC